MAVLAAAVLWGCAVPGGGPAPQAAAGAPQAEAERSVPPPAWKAFKLPGKASTRYEWREHEGESVLHAQADSSASMWRHVLRVDTAQFSRVAFRWKVPALIAGADLSERDGDDAPVRIVLAFDGEHQRLPLRDRMLFELAETLTGEAPPYATLMYVWDPRAPLDSVIRAPRSDRVRGVVVESGAQRVGRWLSYERDIVADYRRAYGEEPGALIGVAVMTDSDNTRSKAEGFYANMRLVGAQRSLRLL